MFSFPTYFFIEITFNQVNYSQNHLGMIIQLIWDLIEIKIAWKLENNERPMFLS